MERQIVELEVADLLINALEHDLKSRKKSRIYKYASLVTCENCFHNHVLDYMSLVLVHGGKCQLCGEKFHYGFETLITKANKRGVKDG
ncbi:MAG: hypothetical protein QXZ27_00335 [Candidatus Bathyarchaeia archaeon]